jgi:hypothetical protein
MKSFFKRKISKTRENELSQKTAQNIPEFHFKTVEIIDNQVKT